MIASTKPTKKGPYKGTPPTPTLGDYASEAQITATGQAKAQVNAFDQAYLGITQPYARAAELRNGHSYQKELRRMMEEERGEDYYPPKRAGNERGGRFIHTR